MPEQHKVQEETLDGQTEWSPNGHKHAEITAAKAPAGAFNSPGAGSRGPGGGGGGGGGRGG